MNVQQLIENINAEIAVKQDEIDRLRMTLSVIEGGPGGNAPCR
jgi:uncharacterized coiled-coil protein SlyX